ncbi:MAG: DUF1217 domain-containing protein [Hyphomicrobiaceae bacterium]
MLTTTASYSLISRDFTVALERKANEPFVAREAEHYLSRISEIKTLDEFVEDSRVFNFAMRAHGLSEMTYAKAFMTKVLKEGIDDPESFANGLSDTRFRDFAEVFNFARYSDATTAFGRTQQETVDKYIRQTLEEDAGLENPGVRLALYFERRADDITNAFSILADRALLEVVQTVLQLPPSIATQDIDRQAELIESRIDIEELKDPEKLGEFLERFTSLWDINNPQSAPVTPSILVGQPIQFGLSASLLTSLQNMRLGGR